VVVAPPSGGREYGVPPIGVAGGWPPSECEECLRWECCVGPGVESSGGKSGSVRGKWDWHERSFAHRGKGGPRFKGRW